MLLIILGFPWWAVDLLSSGVSLINTLFPDPPKPCVKLKNLARIQRHLHHCHPTICHCKFKSPHMQARHSNFGVLGGWASLPMIMPHVQSLLDCLVQPPSLAPMFVFYNMICCTHLLTTFSLRTILLNLWDLLDFLPSLAVQTIVSLSHSIQLWDHPSSTRIVS